MDAGTEVNISRWTAHTTNHSGSFCAVIIVIGRRLGAIIITMIGFCQIDAQNSSVGSILDVTLNSKAAEVTVTKVAWFPSRLLHVLAQFFDPIVTNILPTAKNRFVGLSLVLKSDLPPALQALGEKPLNDIDEDVVLVVADASRASATS